MDSKISGVVIALLGLGLSACGGGNGGNGGGNGNPPPPQSNDNLIDLQYSESFPAAAATVQATRTGDRTQRDVTSAQSGIGSDVSIDYDADDGTYTINVDQAGVSRSSTFGPQKDSDSSSSTRDFYRKPLNSGGGDQETLQIFVPGNDTFRLTYVTFGIWQREVGRDEDGGRVQDVESTFFAFGVRTPAADMPDSGTATFGGRVEGYLIDDTGISSLAGMTQINANFGSGDLEGSFDLEALNVKDELGDEVPFDVLTGNASISGNEFSGAIEGTNTDYSGDWDGGFFGPNAEEIGGSFRMTDGDNQAVGAFVGKQ